MSRSRPFYGWAVVAAVFAMLTVTAGLGFYNMTVYLRALTVEQGFSVGAVSGATAVFFLVSGITGLPVAGLIQRHDVRFTIAAGALVAGLSLSRLGHVTELWQLYVLYAFFGAGFAASALVPGTTVVTRWFARRRSVALSIASTGLSVGGIVVTPLSATLISRHGLDAVAPWLGLILVIGIIPITAAVIRPDPGVLGLGPDGDEPTPDFDESGAPTVADGTPFAQAVRSRFFVALTAAYVLVMLSQVGGLAHIFNLVSERLDEGQAATAVSVVAATSVVARLAGGLLVTVVSMRAFTGVLMVGQGGALAILAAGQGRLALLGGAVALGATVGNLLMLHPLLLAEAFGVRDYGRIYSVSQLVMTIGIASGPALIGAVHDIVDGYTLALGVTAAACALAAVALAATGPVDRAGRGA